MTITLTNANSDFLGALKKLLSAWQGITLNTYDETKTPISALSLVGAWEDERTADEIIRDIESCRTNDSRFGNDYEIFG